MANFRELLKSVQTRAMLIMPIRHPQSVLAFLIFASAEPHEWSSYEIEILTDLADYLAISIRENFMQEEREQMNRQLRESQKMEAVGRLVGGVAHDFNNLLTGMMIYSGLLSSALGPDSPLQRHVREIQSAGERGASLVGQLLSLGSSQVLERRWLSLNDVVVAMREMLQRMMGEEILFECHLAGELFRSRLDENHLRQALLNLAINARDAMQAGGKLSIRTANRTVDAVRAKGIQGLQPGDYAVLSVTDTGVGMSAETLAHCFEPFYTTKPTGQGTGLGLASVYGMVKQHGGHADVRSSRGRGTTIDLYFPVADSAADDETAPRPAERSPTTVLLVEDEDMLRIPLTEKLRSEGYRVLSALGGEGALESARRFGRAIDLLVSDLVMPGMSGTELAERLMVQRPDLRVLYMSGYTHDPRALRLIAAGANFLRKPFNAQTFAQRVGELVEPGRAMAGHHEGQQKSISSLGKET